MFAFRRPLTIWIDDTRGTVAILFALLSIVIVALLGLAIDVGQANKQQNKMQGALDGASLAAGRASQLSTGNSTKVNAAAQAYFKQHAPAGAQVTVSSSDSYKTIQLSGTFDYQTSFARVFGAPFRTFTINKSATTKITQSGAAARNTESVLVMDVSGSMKDNIGTLRTVANDFVDIVTWIDQSVATSKVALLPFASGVSLDDSQGGQGWFQGLTGAQAQPVAHWCIARRAKNDDSYPAGVWNLTDPGATPTDQTTFAAYTFYVGDTSNPKKCTIGITPAQPSFWGLSTDVQALHDHINRYTAGGDSDGQTAMQVAALALAPSNPFGGAAAYDVTKTRKIVALITDGLWNLQKAPGGTCGQGCSIPTPVIQQACAAMKANGVEIYAIYYPTDTGNANKLKSCVTDTAHFYDATINGRGFEDSILASALRDIALKISVLRLTQ